jgi:hypothetical protein
MAAAGFSVVVDSGLVGLGEGLGGKEETARSLFRLGRPLWARTLSQLLAVIVVIVIPVVREGRVE